MMQANGITPDFAEALQAAGLLDFFLGCTGPHQREYWWQIEDPPDSKSPRNRDSDLTVPEGATPWLVHSGQWYGSLASSSTGELWSWDGQAAKRVREVCHAIS